MEDSDTKRTADIHVDEDLSFSIFTLSDKLLKSLHKMNFIKPSPIQLKVVPLARSGLDMILQAKSGTGKTLAFSICLFENYDPEIKFPQALILVPTREIAVQIVSVLSGIGKNLKNFKSCEFIGGTDVTEDRKRIQAAKFVVGTPGRILHLIKNEIFNISNLKTIVLDEADKLVESGKMAKEVLSILDILPKKIQIIAATATVTGQLEKIMKKKMKNPIGITPKHEVPVLLGVKQFVKVVPRENDNIKLMTAKIEELQKIFTRITFKQCLLFTESQTKTETYGNYLAKQGWKNEIISGAQDQSQRLQVLEKLIKFKCRILITTDLMARGIDIENINLIVNLELPHDCNTYLHRIGRSGRFGTHGIAITLVNGEEELEKFQKMLGNIGGDSLKAMKYPDESVSYDFWDFSDQQVLETVSGFSKDSEESCEEDQDDVVANNLALFEITKKLVDTKKPEKKFDLEAMLDDYQKSMQNGNHKVEEKTSGNCEDENIFLKTIEDLHLYEDDQENEEKNFPSEKAQEDEKAQKEKWRVVFKRNEVEDEAMSDDSSEASSEEESEENEDSSEDESEEDEDESSYIPKPQAKRPKCDNQNDAFEGFYFSYDQYVSNGYSQWRNIYHFQLASIQNYLRAAKQ